MLKGYFDEPMKFQNFKMNQILKIRSLKFYGIESLFQKHKDQKKTKPKDSNNTHTQRLISTVPLFAMSCGARVRRRHFRRQHNNNNTRITTRTTTRWIHDDLLLRPSRNWHNSRLVGRARRERKARTTYDCCKSEMEMDEAPWTS